ncbi:MAG: AEC family transporter [Paenibacillus macerans]|uniref:AEC family transporter n=1 Tax=Paenibacillus macerans TaxID=44252 RepID=A0A090YRJ2_PAEMA|nr:AEC family transporter [Paenibacillus macerans]KFN00877.1 membrane transport family protein [Paenibacillus macerans]MBS5911896.1 AEC family transporter [Paenibacillus macerans]MCY7561915.1 AEC family transporter [Paenibacillus macerans]MDU5946761.1 AEC family transporter [Paenibacillus macerans]MDU7476601.1 AEC family transporter [Paenibacillus macerans]
MIGDIILEVVLPIFVLIGLGCLMQRAFRLDLYTLSKINFYFITPAVVFLSMYQSQMSAELLGSVTGFYVLYVLLLWGISMLVSRTLKFSRGLRAAFTNSLILDNSGNYGLPINQLAFKGDPLAASVQALVMTFQSLVTFTYGVMSVQRAKSGGTLKAALIGFLKMPVPYALVLGMALHVLNLPLPYFVSKPMGYIADSMVAVALLTLGAQIVKYPLRLDRFDVYVSVALRLLIGPAIGFGLILLLGLKGVPAQALLLASGMPTGVNSTILAEEYDNEPDFASQTVLISTLLNIVTMTALISLAKYVG